jgi:hypothetical protein
MATDDHYGPVDTLDRPPFPAAVPAICEIVEAAIMTPTQRRLLHPLRPQAPGEKLCNLINLAWTLWPLSVCHAAMLAYCETFSAVLDPLSPGDFYLGPE